MVKKTPAQPLLDLPVPAPLYRLTRPLYLGEMVHPVGAELFFAEGTAPSTAIRLADQLSAEPVSPAEDTDEE